MSEQEISQDTVLEESEFEELSEEDYVSPLASGDVEEIEEIDLDDDDFDFDDEEDDDTFVSDLADDEIVSDDEEGFTADFEDSGSTALAVNDEGAGELIEAPALSVEEATELTEHIRSTADVLYVLVARAHAGKAHVALGYANFAEYVKAEFNISRSRAYQFLNQASVIAAIEDATPEGTHFRLSEAAARDLKNYVEELAPAIREATEGLGSNEAGKVVESMVGEYRDKLKDEKSKAADDSFDADLDMNFDLDDIDYDAPSFDGEGGGGGGSQFDDMDNFDNLDDFDSATGSTSSDPSIDIEEASVFRTKLENVYAFYAALNSLEKMPPAEEIIDSIQESRRSHLNASIPKAKAWLDSIYDSWFAKDGNSPVEADNDTETGSVEESDAESVEFEDFNNDFDDLSEEVVREDQEDFDGSR